MEDWWDDPPSSFPIFILAVDNASSTQEIKGFTKEWMLVQLDCLNKKILYDIRMGSHDRHVGEGISNDQIILADFFFENIKQVLILFNQVQQRQTHEFVGQLKDFVAFFARFIGETSDSLFRL